MMVPKNILGLIEITRLVAAAEDKLSPSSEELLRVYDFTGNELGVAPRIICHRLGLIHKVVLCFLRDGRGRLLLQTRRGGRLDVSVGGHLNVDDSSAEESVAREMHEEMGISISDDRIVRISEYLRYSSGRISKAREVNNELRVLFSCELSDAELANLDEQFEKRLDKPGVQNIEWFELERVIQACDEGKAADGLSASLSHYLMWLIKSDPQGTL